MGKGKRSASGMSTLIMKSMAAVLGLKMLVCSLHAEQRGKWEPPPMLQTPGLNKGEMGFLRPSQERLLQLDSLYLTLMQTSCLNPDHTNLLGTHEALFKASACTLVLLQCPGALWVATCRTGKVLAAWEKGFLALCLVAYKGFFSPAYYF